MNWALKHRLIILGTIIVFVASIASIIVFFSLPTPEPTCTYEGVPIECGLSVEPLSVPLVRYIRTGTRPDVVAYITNGNTDADAQYVNYRIDVYTKKGDLFATQKGSVTIPHETTHAIFIPRVASFAPEQAQAFLTLTSTPQFTRATTPTVHLTQEGFSWSLLGSTPRLVVDIRGDKNTTVHRVPAIVTVYDADNVLIAASRTVVQSLAANTQGTLTYTWNQPFKRPPARVEVIFNTP